MDLWVFVLGGGLGVLVGACLFVPPARWEAIREGRLKEARDHEWAMVRAQRRRALQGPGLHYPPVADVPPVDLPARLAHLAHTPIATPEGEEA